MTNIVNWSPFRDMDDMFSRYRRLMPTNGGKTEGIGVDWQPAADISETKKEYLIKAELPEVERKDVHVAIDSGRITIAARGEWIRKKRMRPNFGSRASMARFRVASRCRMMSMKARSRPSQRMAC